MPNKPAVVHMSTDHSIVLRIILQAPALGTDREQDSLRSYNKEGKGLDPWNPVLCSLEAVGFLLSA